jgi:ankyrin repeat protein
MTGEYNIAVQDCPTGLVQEQAVQPSGKIRGRYKNVHSMEPRTVTANSGRSCMPQIRPMAQEHVSHDGAIRQSAAAQLSRIIGPSFHAGVEASRNNTMLMAARNGKTQLMGLLLEMGGSIAISNELGMTPLMLAILSGSRAAIEMLLDAGADINACDCFNNTPLMYAARMNDVIHIYALRRGGADVNARNGCRDTALICAIRENNLLVVQALLDPDSRYSVAADPAATDLYGTAPLFIAMEARKQIGSLARLTLDGAGNSGQRTPAFNHWGEEIRKNSTIIAALFGAGIHVDTTDNNGNTLQVYAVMMRDEGLVTMLRDTGANPELENINGKSAMKYALEIGLPSLLDLLQNRR